MIHEEVLESLDSATARLVTTIEHLNDAQLREPSLLPGWSRAHVLSHISGNADGIRNLLLAARSGQHVRMYANPETRDANIEVNVTRPTGVILADGIESSRRFLVEAHAMPAEAWQAEVSFSSGQPNPRSFPGERLAALRLIEVEIHHVDLAGAYTFADAPGELIEWLLTDLTERRAATLEQIGDALWVAGVGEHGAVQRCHGSAPDLLAWFAGRSSGTGVTVETGELPAIPGFG